MRVRGGLEQSVLKTGLVASFLGDHAQFSPLPPLETPVIDWGFLFNKKSTGSEARFLA